MEPASTAMTSTPMNSTELLLKLNKVSWSAGNRLVLNNIDLSLHRGEILTVIGPNGAGKSCLLKLALGLSMPAEGRVWRAPSVRIGYMPQQININPYLPLTVADFMQLATPKTTSPAWFLGLGRQHHFSRKAMLNALAEVGVEHLLVQPVQQLSGGEMQRVLLARALLKQPDILVLDEPVQGVDVSGQAELYGIIKTLRDRHGCAVLMVSHDLHVVMAATDLVLCLNQHVCCSGHPELVSQHPEYLRLFGPTATSDLAIYTHHHDHHHTLHGDPASCDEDCKHG